MKFKKNQFRCAGCDDLQSGPCIQIPLSPDDAIGYCLYCAPIVMGYMRMAQMAWEEIAMRPKQKKRKK